MMTRKIKHGSNSFNDVFHYERTWWIFGLRGILAIVFGMIAVFRPISTVIVMTIIFGAYTVADGIFDLITGFNRSLKGWQKASWIISSLLSIILGLIILFTPDIASIGLVDFLWIIVAMWSIITGVLEIITAMQLAAGRQGKGLLTLRGIFFVLSGLSLLLIISINPVAGLVTLAWFIGANSLASGAMLIALAFKHFKLEKSDLHHHINTKSSTY